MARKPTLEPRWLVGLLACWARRASYEDSRGLGYPSLCVMLKGGIPGRVRSYEPTGYSDEDFRQIQKAVEALETMRKLAILRYFQPWKAPLIDAETPFVMPGQWLGLLTLALGDLERSLERADARA